MAKKRPKQPKIVKIAVFGLLVNEEPIEIDPNTSNRKLIISRKKLNNRTSVKRYKWLPHKITTS